MTIVIRIFRWIARLAAYAIATTIILALIALLIVGLTPFGARFAADSVSKIASTPERTVAIGTPSGLLSGNLRIDRITVADTRGTYAEIRDLAVDWSPLSLLAATFDADLVTAASINVIRAPEKPAQEAQTNSSGGFSLPVAIDIRRILLPDIDLGADLAGKDFSLAAEGSLKAGAKSIALQLKASRKDQPQARAMADIVFAPADNRLTLKADLAEPQGGLIAKMLRLPEEPALDLSLNGEGPLSNWSGKLAAAMDGQPILSVNGRHQLLSTGLHRLDVKGGGAFARLMPPAFRPLFDGTTDIDLSAAFDATGRISIESGNITTGSLLLAASGTLDPAGQNSLKANLIGTAGPVDFRWPLAEGEARLLIDGADLSLTGAASAAKLNVTAALTSVDLPQGHFGKLRLTARSDAFDLANRAGPVETRFSVEQSDFRGADLGRAIRAPLTVTAPLVVSPQAIAFDAATIESASIGGTLSGRYDLTVGSLTSTFRLFAVPAVLPEALAAKFDTTIATQGRLTAIVGGKISIADLTLKSGTIEANGDVALNNNELTAALSGRLPDLGKLLADASGAAAFDLSADGPLSALAVKAAITADDATLSGRKLKDLSVEIDGKADPAAPQATVKASGSLGGQTIGIAADLVSKDGVTRLPKLTADIGPNRLQGQLTFTPSFEPDGRLTFDLPDLSLIAALAGQKAAGDLKGSVELASGNGRIRATVSASGGAIRRDEVRIVKPAIDMTVDDLKAFSAKGTVRADEIVSAGNRIGNLALDLRQASGKTGFDLKAIYDSAPLLSNGSIESGRGTTRIDLQTFSAAPRKIPLKLAAPATIAVTNGTATISGLTIRAGNGSVTVNGSAGQTLDLDARIANLPANLANSFASSLGAEGSLSGTVAVRGNASAPAVDYQLSWTDAATSQTRAAGLGPIGIKAGGRFADNTVRIDVNLSGADGLALNGGGTVALSGAKALALKFSGSLPFSALAGQLTSRGFSMKGKAAIDLAIAGTTAAPAITGTVNTTGAEVIDVRRNLALKDLGAAVTFDRDRATLSRLSAKLSTGGTISATGTVGITSGSGFPADINIVLGKTTYVDGTVFTTIIDGTLTLKGPLLASPTLGGNLRLDETSITVPEKLPASLAELDVEHRNASKAVRAQAKAVGTEESSGTNATINLDLTVNAPSQIFVRGRGMDAELGGDVTIRGTAADPIVSGGFQMRRGRMIILNRRLDFTTGTIGFGGALTPMLDMNATTVSGSTTVTVSVRGVANDPSINFSSSPALPQDEILAQLIFGQSMSKLSALQIAQLADAASQLAGGRTTSLFQSLRSNLGIDDLDVSTDEKGQAKVSAGKYLNKRTYIELQQSGDSSSKAIINLDVGRGIKLRGAAGSDGSGAAGIFYEKEY